MKTNTHVKPLLLALLLCACTVFAQGVVPLDPDWREETVPPPPAVRSEGLIPLDIPGSSLRFGIDPALRKLPAVGADSLAPEHLVFLVEQDDADVGPKAVPVKHNQTPNL